VTKKYQKNEIDTPAGDGVVMPKRVSVAMAEIAGSMREGLLASTRPGTISSVD
jgi:hypothetical protein